MPFVSRLQPLLAIITPSPLALLTIALLMIVENAFGLAMPWIAGQFTHTILNGTSALPFSYQTILIFWLIGLTIQIVLGYVHRVFSGSTSERMLMQLRIRIYDHLQSLPIGYFHERKHGATLALITNDCTIISSFITTTVVGLLPQLLTATGAVICIFTISHAAAFLISLLIPIFLVTTKIFGRRLRPASRRLFLQYDATVAMASENLASLPIIKSFTREDLESARFAASNLEFFTLSVNYLRAHASLNPLVRFLSFTIILGVLWVLSDDIALGTLQPGHVVSLMLYGMLLAQPVGRLADTYGAFQKTLTSADRLISVLSTPSEVTPGGIRLTEVQGRLDYENVTFSYPGREPTLKNLSLTVAAGETIAITGENGAGKSTLAHLLLRFILPQQGQIRLDGHDIGSISLESLRAHIGLVQQNVLLQNSSIADNIRFGKPNATEQEIITAAQAAHALDFINLLPHGFQTRIGDQGVKLSGGQKQRLSLARALLKNPAILIFDEATAMFDPEGEHAFITTNRELFKNRTVLIITHRPASLALADRVLLLENGVLRDTQPKPPVISCQAAMSSL